MNQPTSNPQTTEPSQEQIQEMVNLWREWSAQTPGLRSSVNDLMRRAYRVARETEPRGCPPPGVCSALVIFSRFREALEEIRSRETEEMSDMSDPNCYGTGYSSGMIAASDELIVCLDEVQDV